MVGSSNLPVPTILIGVHYGLCLVLFYIPCMFNREKIVNTLKDMVKDQKKVKFTHYIKKELWYETECGFSFPVPIEDCGDAVFLPEDKAILFMRYIRNHISFCEKD